MSRFCCLYFRHFPAWAARRADTSLESVPFAIYAREKVVAASPEAILAGAQIGWTVRRLQSRLPEVRILALNAAQAESVWEDVLAALYSLTPRVESIRQGLLMADINAPRVVDLVREWGVRGGLAGNRPTAELAAYAARGREVRVIPPGRHEGFFDTLPLATLSDAGITPETIERLNWFGWTTIGALSALTEPQLLAQFPKEGRTLYRYAQAADVRRVPIYVPPVTIVQRFAFDEPAMQPNEWGEALREAIECACVELGDRQAGRLTVTGEGSISDYQASRLLREPLANRRTLFTFAYQMLLEALPVDTPVGVCAVEVMLCNLTQMEVVQEELFETPGKRRAISGFRRVLLRLESRFPEKMKRAVILNLHAPLPEERYRYEPAVKVETSATPAKKGGTKKLAVQKPSAKRRRK